MSRKATELVRGGKYVAEVEVEYISGDEVWGAYLSAEDVMKLDRVRKALQRGDLKAASEEARVYELKPVAVG
jgi:hypothetical protein